MATTRLPADFSQFLRLLNAHRVEYLLIGGYAVGYYGYVRATADIDLWVSNDPENASRIVAAIKEFGFNVLKLTPTLFTKRDSIVRMGLPPLRIELLTTISGVKFHPCYLRRVVDELDGIEVPIRSLEDLKENKRQSGRDNALLDLDRLP